jgi:hypothetical protein
VPEEGLRGAGCPGSRIEEAFVRALLIPGFFLALVAARPGAAGAVEIDAAYRVTWLGLLVAEGTIAARTDADGYVVAYSFGTAGFLRVLADAQAAAEARGRLAGDRATPRSFVADGRWRDHTHRSRLDFNPDGTIATMQVDADDADREPVPQALRQAPDPLSLAVEAALGAAAGRTLDGRSFDGRRAAEARLACGGLEAVSDGTGRPDVPALRCEMTARLVAGASRRYRGRSTRLDGPITVWLEPAVVPGVAWPIRVDAPTTWGHVIATLERLSVSPAPRAAVD